MLLLAPLVVVLALLLLCWLLHCLTLPGVCLLLRLPILVPLLGLLLLPQPLLHVLCSLLWLLQLMPVLLVLCLLLP
jgi:hypothetical protein